MVAFIVVYRVPISLAHHQLLLPAVLRVSFILKDECRAFVFVIL